MKRFLTTLAVVGMMLSGIDARAEQELVGSWEFFPIGGGSQSFVTFHADGTVTNARRAKSAQNVNTTPPHTPPTLVNVVWSGGHGEWDKIAPDTWVARYRNTATTDTTPSTLVGWQEQAWEITPNGDGTLSAHNLPDTLFHVNNGSGETGTVASTVVNTTLFPLSAE